MHPPFFLKPAMTNKIVDSVREKRNRDLINLSKNREDGARHRKHIKKIVLQSLQESYAGNNCKMFNEDLSEFTLDISRFGFDVSTDFVRAKEIKTLEKRLHKINGIIATTGVNLVALINEGNAANRPYEIGGSIKEKISFLESYLLGIRVEIEANEAVINEYVMLQQGNVGKIYEYYGLSENYMAVEVQSFIRRRLNALDIGPGLKRSVSNKKRTYAKGVKLLNDCDEFIHEKEGVESELHELLMEHKVTNVCWRKKPGNNASDAYKLAYWFSCGYGRDLFDKIFLQIHKLAAKSHIEISIGTNWDGKKIVNFGSAPYLLPTFVNLRNR